MSLDETHRLAKLGSFCFRVNALHLSNSVSINRNGTSMTWHVHVPNYGNTDHNFSDLLDAVHYAEGVIAILEKIKTMQELLQKSVTSKDPFVEIRYLVQLEE